VVRALIDHVGANLNDFKQPNPILRDLRAAEALLTVAEARGCGSISPRASCNDRDLIAVESFLPSARDKWVRFRTSPRALFAPNP
jgi:hypothetical protein